MISHEPAPNRRDYLELFLLIVLLACAFGTIILTRLNYERNFIRAFYEKTFRR
jgi:predicted outer membrane lipoprotein